MSQYKERDLMKLDKDGNWYSTHVRAMTAEDLRSKSDIAAELGFRDKKIADLEAYIVELEADANEMMDSIQVLIEELEVDGCDSDLLDSQKSNLEHWSLGGK